MKYYGFKYEGLPANYQIKNAPAYDTPYEALVAANKKWKSSSDMRLLVVIRECDSDDATASETMAFFQFTDSQSCSEFANRLCEIIWSSPEEPRWNGNATIMG